MSQIQSFTLFQAPVLAAQSNLEFSGVVATFQDSVLPGLPSQLPPLSNQSSSSNQIQAAWIWLDGIRLFQVTDHPEQLAQRRRRIQGSLQEIYREYLNNQQVPGGDLLRVEVRTSNQLPVIYINDQYLMTATQADGQFQGLPVEVWANQLRMTLTQRLQELRRQRQPDYLIAQAEQLGLFILGVMLGSLLLIFLKRRIHRQPVKRLAFETDAWVKHLSQQQQTRLRGIKLMLLQLGQMTFGILAILFSLSRFPQTRPIAIHLISLFQIPLVLALALFISYLVIRFIHLLIDRFSLAVVTNPIFTNKSTNSRAQQRISTLARVLKGIVLVVTVLTAVLVSLPLLGISIGPLLAGVGILGVGISLASQGLIKDAIHGALILVEDQYGVGDVIEIGEWTGLVETLNLRMTQLRNAEGKLITIPNSEVRIVANLANQWSRVNLNIPIPYDTDLTTMMALVESTARSMMEDEQWKALILEAPELLGVDDFSDRGVLLKLWIKTQPLRQWDVAREYRRRLKLAMDEAQITIPVPQRSLQFPRN